MLCQDCEKRSKCRSLCPKAFTYVNQDFVKLRQRTVQVREPLQPWPDPITPTVLTKTQADIVYLLLQGLRRMEVAKKLGISTDAFDRRYKRIKLKLRRQEEEECCGTTNEPD